MMKFIFLFLLAVSPLIAFDGSYVPRAHLHKHFSVDFKVSAFRPDSEILREIFDDHWINYQVEFDTVFYKCYRLWGAINFMHNSGRSLLISTSGRSVEGHDSGKLNKDRHKDPSELGHNKTSIRVIPVTLGVDYVYMFNRHCEFYAGAGLRYFFLDVHNHPHHKKKNSPKIKLLHTPHNRIRKIDVKEGFGAGCRIGSIINITESFTGDLFLDYSWKKFEFRHSSTKHDINISGVSLGTGIGYRF